jgi:hypothetical protein
VLGGVTGVLVGLLAPDLARGLQALDGPEPPASFSPTLFGLEFGAGLGAAWGAGLGLLLGIGSLLFPRLLRHRLGTLLLMVAVSATMVGILMGCWRSWVGRTRPGNGHETSLGS